MLLRFAIPRSAAAPLKSGCPRVILEFGVTFFQSSVHTVTFYESQGFLMTPALATPLQKVLLYPGSSEDSLSMSSCVLKKCVSQIVRLESQKDSMASGWMWSYQ